MGVNIKKLLLAQEQYNNLKEELASVTIFRKTVFDIFPGINVSGKLLDSIGLLIDEYRDKLKEKIENVEV